MDQTEEDRTYLLWICTVICDMARRCNICTVSLCPVSSTARCPLKLVSSEDNHRPARRLGPLTARLLVVNITNWFSFPRTLRIFYNPPVFFLFLLRDLVNIDQLIPSLHDNIIVSRRKHNTWDNDLRSSTVKNCSPSKWYFCFLDLIFLVFL